MNALRRALLGIVALGLAKPWAALAAWNKEAFGAKTADAALKGIGIGAATPTRDLAMEAPEIAENGAVVPVEITSNLPGTTSIAVLVDKNPFPLVGTFDFTAGAVPFVKLNLKMGETSEVRVIAQAGGRSYVATKEIKVTIGGCGG